MKISPRLLWTKSDIDLYIRRLSINQNKPKAPFNVAEALMFQK